MEGTAVLDQCYMDDLMPSAPTVDEAKETRRQLTELGDKAGHVWARSCSVPSQWRYVPTNVKPGDHRMRGLTVAELANTSQWWKCN